MLPTRSPPVIEQVAVNWPARCAGTTCFYKHIGCVLPGMANDVLDFGVDKTMQDVPVKLHAELRKQPENSVWGRKVTTKELQRLCRDGVAKPPPKEVKKPPKQAKKQKVADVPREKVVVGSGPVRERAPPPGSPSLEMEEAPYESDWGDSDA